MARVGTAPQGAQEAPVQTEQTVMSVAREALDDAGGDVVKATEIMAAQITFHPHLYRALMDPLVRTACYEAVARICQGRRQTIWNTRQPSASEQKGRVIALADRKSTRLNS